MGCHKNNHAHPCQHSSSTCSDSEFILHKYIDFPKLTCLNEKAENSCLKIFTRQPKSIIDAEFVESDADEALLFFIPFTGLVILKSIIIMGAGDLTEYPKTVKLYPNKEGLDFENVEDFEAAQTIDLVADVNGLVKYPINVCKFQNVWSLNLYFSHNFGAESTKISFIGLSGEFRQAKKDLGFTLYELNPNPSDHKLEGFGSFTPQLT
ncbi:PITH domain-containing protein 1-like [Zophobas morio]|uniref:PITH domain-containing protein 1-like n=1 Tax=Zophobas morio TaxID=2755281 RepID=UPI003083A1F2